ncbi:D-cysteine desulfhydrase family protein [Exilibacterium tricleocarpae]|uniref:D-cysteine desulfhydrase family protein n=1 Tax=Exilibacterium tricleocarpae TaxID=2591008 RepID=A0A545T8F7_9GAMM|nr:D-cysteine desulfhydrase family protein [Exilibacterium tricleocarpae]TQV73510.1 D-cysteine desulfhydrase family protein [Exilibacterium tricleocarpae]
MTLVYPQRLALARTPTPLQPLDRLSDHLGGPRLWVKRDDLTGSVLSGNKVRKLEFVLAEAQRQGCDTLLTCGGLQSNHCRATALLGAQLGLSVHLILRGEAPAEVDGNLLLDYLAGARVSYYAQAEFQTDLEAIFQRWQAHYRSLGRKAFSIPTGASDEIGVWGYVRACEELAEDFHTHRIAPSHIVTATGSGGTQAGLSVGARLLGLGCRVVGMAVCDDAAYFREKVGDDLLKWQRCYAVEVELGQVDVITNDRYIGAGYAKASPEVFETIKLVAGLEGLVLDPVYTGKAFHGMISEIKAGGLPRHGDIVFIHTGGVFGLFPQRRQLLASITDSNT